MAAAKQQHTAFVLGRLGPRASSTFAQSGCYFVLQTLISSISQLFNLFLAGLQNLIARGHDIVTGQFYNIGGCNKIILGGLLGYTHINR
jgi:hypothetical protein